MSTGDSTAEKHSESTESAHASTEQKKEEHRKALAQIAEDYHRDLVLFLTARVGSKEKARELAQETYAKVLALDRTDTISFLAGYVWKTARNLATDLGIQNANRGRLDELVYAGIERHAPSPEAEVYKRQRLELISKALEELRQERPRWYEAYVLRVVEERKVQDVARIMDIAPRNVVAYVAKAAQHCQGYLDAAEGTLGNQNNGE